MQNVASDQGSGCQMFAYIIFYQNLNKIIQYQPTNIKWISTGPLGKSEKFHLVETVNLYPGPKNSTPPLVFTSASGCRASENFDNF